MTAKQFAPAAARNREPIREVLATCLPASGVVVEIASGTGEHAVHFARAFPALEWQPTDVDDVALASIAAWREEVALPNLRAPLRLNVADAAWPAADAIACSNMIHIAPWEATLALFAGAARVLANGALLFTYGPYRFDGKTAASNDDFDRSLKSRDPRWGVRDVTDLRAVAHGFTLAEIVAMPANNHSLIWRRT
jgi:hypothetical protein